MAVPAVEFDRAHLHAGENAIGVLDIEIVLVPPVLLLDRDVMDMIAERARVMLLENAFLRAPLRTADEADRAARHMRVPARRDRGGLVAAAARGRFRFGEDKAVGGEDLQVSFCFWSGPVDLGGTAFGPHM